MRKMLVIAGIALSSLLVTGSAFAQGTPTAPPAPPAPSGGTPNERGEAEKKIGIGGDLLFLIPLGDLSDASGPQFGPLVRGGYRVIPNLEVTARLGYLIGLKKDRSFNTGLGTLTVSSGFNLIPVWAGARYFFMDPDAGVYGAAEIGLNVLVPTTSSGTAGDSQTRFGANLGAGYVISKELPIDIRAQLTMYNLLGKNDTTVGTTTINEPTYLGIGISGGYTFQF